MGRPAAPSQFLAEACIRPLGVDETEDTLEAEEIAKQGSLISASWLDMFIQEFPKAASLTVEHEARLLQAWDF